MWFMSVQFFLIATFGFSYQKKFEVLSKALWDDSMRSAVKNIFVSLLLYDLFLLSLVMIGISTSYVAKRSVGTAAVAVKSLELRWSNLPKEIRGAVEIRHLPGLTGGGDEKAAKNEVKFAKAMPKLFFFLWVGGAIFVFLVLSFDFRYLPA